MERSACLIQGVTRGTQTRREVGKVREAEEERKRAKLKALEQAVADAAARRKKEADEARAADEAASQAEAAAQKAAAAELEAAQVLQLQQTAEEARAMAQRETEEAVVALAREEEAAKFLAAEEAAVAVAAEAVAAADPVENVTRHELIQEVRQKGRRKMWGCEFCHILFPTIEECTQHEESCEARPVPKSKPKKTRKLWQCDYCNALHQTLAEAAACNSPSPAIVNLVSYRILCPPGDGA